MSRTLLIHWFRETLSVIREAEVRNIPPGEVVHERAIRSEKRREFLKLAAGAAGGLALPALARGKPNADLETPRIAVVGAGLAGLTAAYRLRRAGYRAKVFEASERVGGRCLSLRNHFADGQIVERGGELIDQGHKYIRSLANELGLKLDNLLQAEPNGLEQVYYFDGEPYTYREATRDIKGIWQKLHRDVAEASYPTLYNQYTARGLELDHLSIADWIEESVPGGRSSKLGRLLDVAYNIEYGAAASEQSSLNLIYLLGYRGQGQLRIFGPSNEKYWVRGGNDQIAMRLAQELDGQIRFDNTLLAIRQTLTGGYTLSFRSGAGVVDEVFDKVILAIPFSILRTAVDYQQGGFSPLKKIAIEELPMGTNAKLQLQFVERYWERLGYNGETFADTGYQNTWQVTRSQPGPAGILNNYTGETGKDFLSETPEFYARRFLDQIEPVFTGLSAYWNGKVSLDYWPANPLTLGSYAYWKVGQYTRFAGVEREREGNCHFAGEHTSVDFQGYLNGAVESGERSAAEILAEL